MQILVVYDCDGVYDAFSGSGDDIIDALKDSRYWEKIVQRLQEVFENLSEDEISLGMITDHLDHDGDSLYGFTFLPTTGPTMSHEEKIKYMTDALNLCGFGIKEEYTDLLVRIYDLLLEKEGATSLKDIFHVKQEHKKAFPNPKPKEDEAPSTQNETTNTDGKPDL